MKDTDSTTTKRLAVATAARRFSADCPPIVSDDHRRKSANRASKSSFAAAVLFFSAFSAVAGQPPYIAPELLPPVTAKPAEPPQVPHASKPHPEIRPYTALQIERSTLSGAYLLAMAHAAPAAVTAEAEQTRDSSAASRQGVRATTDSVVAATANASNDTASDVEPTVIAITANNSNGVAVDTTMTTWVKYATNDTSSPHIHYSGTTQFSTLGSGTPFTRGQLPLYPGYLYSGDPALSEFPYRSTPWPQRMYCAGIMFVDNVTPQSNNNAIAVWHLDGTDGGVWQSTSIQLADTRGANYLLDKPSIAVSLRNSPGFGYVYVAYTSLDYVNNNTAIVVARSTDGGNTFPQKTVVTYGGGDGSGSEVHDAQIVVSSATGMPYVMWIDQANNRIMSARSADFGATWQLYEIAGIGGTMYLGTISGGIKAHTGPIARYNAVNGYIDLVWHDMAADGHTDVHFAYRDGFGWHQQPTPPTQTTAYDQFFPAIDYNNAGQIVLTYYDTSSVYLQARAYDVRQTVLNADGSRISSVDNTLSSSTSLAQGKTQNFIGDYQGVWDWVYRDNVDRAAVSWIGIGDAPTYIYDVWLSDITY